MRDFYGSEFCFIAYGNEKHHADDFYVLSEGIFHHIICRSILEYKRVAAAKKGSCRLPMRKRVMPSRNESLREDRCGSVVPDEYGSYSCSNVSSKTLKMVKIWLPPGEKYKGVS